MMATPELQAPAEAGRHRAASTMATLTTETPAHERFQWLISKLSRFGWLPSPEEATALAQFVRRLGYDDCVQKASLYVFYSGRTEADVMWAALCILQRELAAAGFSPR
jgi:hypothetical protein